MWILENGVKLMKYKKALSIVLSSVFACAAFAGCQFSPATNDLASDSSVSESPVDLAEDTSSESMSQDEEESEYEIDKNKKPPWSLSPQRDAKGNIILTEEQESELQELEETDPTNHYRRQVIMGVIDPEAPRLTFDDVKQILRNARKKYDDDITAYEYIEYKIGNIQPPDYNPPSDSTGTLIYYLDNPSEDKSKQRLIIEPSRGIISYCELNDNQELVRKMWLYSCNKKVKMTADIYITEDDIWYYNGEQEVWFNEQLERIG